MSERNNSIKDLRIYQSSRQVEDKVYDLIKLLPTEEFYALGDASRRSSAAVSHYISEGHRRYSYTLKMEALHLARNEAENLKKHLERFSAAGYGNTDDLQKFCSVITGQAWGLIRYFKKRQTQRQAESRIQAADQMVALRA